MLTPREAFQEADAEASRIAHLARAHAAAEEKHMSEAGGVLASLVFGALDGLTTTFAVLVAAAAGQVSRVTLIILVLSNLVGDAVGMGVGDYLSSRTEEAYEDTLGQQAARLPQEEREARLARHYESEGLSAQDAASLVRLLARNPDAFAQLYLVYQHGIMPDEGGPSAFKRALVTFVAFILVGALPVIAYVASGSYSSSAHVDYIFWISIAIFAVALFALGAIKGRIANSRWWLSGIAMLVQGAMCTAAAWAIGYGFSFIEVHVPHTTLLPPVSSAPPPLWH